MTAPTRRAPSVLGATATPTGLAHVGALDGLRGAAVLVVVLYHLSVSPTAGPMTGVLRGGFLGVDMFFVLSGFLITSLLLIDHAHRGRTVSWRFWERRIRRLLPALLALLALSAAYAVFVANPWELASIRRMGFASLFYVSNWYAIFGHLTTTPLSHTWSLAIEEQWYLVWPLLLGGLLWLVRSRRSWLVLVITLLAAGSFALMAWTFTSDGWVRAYHGTDTRAWELLAGAAVAVVMIGRSELTTRRGRVIAELLGLAGLAGILTLALVATPFDPWMYRWGFALVVVSTIALLMASLQPGSPLLGRALRVRPLVGLGLISYGLYLYHVPVFKWLSPAVVGLTGWPLVVLRVAVSLGLAVVSYRYLEMPVRTRGFRATSLRWAAPAALAAVALLLVTSTTGGRPMSVAESRAEYYTRAGANTDRRTLRLLVAGDGETAEMAAGGVVAAPGMRGLAVPLAFCSSFSRNAVAGGMPPATTGLCPSWRALFGAAVEHFDPAVAVLVSSRATVFDRQVAGVTLGTGTAGLRRALTEDLDQAHGVLTARGARLLVVGVMCAPVAPGEPLAAIAHDEVRRVWVNGILRDYARAHADSVTYVDADRLTCPRDGTWPTVSGTAVHGPDGRLTPAGVRAVWALVGSAVQDQEAVRQ